MLELWSAARYDLGLPRPEFEGLTPRQLGALFDRAADARFREDYRIAVLDALVANAFGAKVTPEDFMPGFSKPRRKQTPQEQYELIQTLHAHFSEVN